MPELAAGLTAYFHSIIMRGPIRALTTVRQPSAFCLKTDVVALRSTFVDSVEAAFEQAKKAAGNKDIVVQGANTAQQLIKAGLIDELFIHLVPVLFGSGTRLFDSLGSEHISLETAGVIETAEAIHLRFRVVKDKA